MICRIEYFRGRTKLHVALVLGATFQERALGGDASPEEVARHAPGNHHLDVQNIALRDIPLDDCKNPSPSIETRQTNQAN
jgi:hypothetical protein